MRQEGKFKQKAGKIRLQGQRLHYINLRYLQTIQVPLIKVAPGMRPSQSTSSFTKTPSGQLMSNITHLGSELGLGLDINGEIWQLGIGLT